MFLDKRTYVRNSDWLKPEERYQITVLRNGQPTAIKPERIKEIIERVAYWRKANAIHQWFVENVQDCQDDCGEYCVQEDDLRQLLSRCRRVLEASELVEGEVINGYRIEDGKEVPIVEKGKVIKDPSTAKALLPTLAGFFFGSTNYDEAYLDDIRYTKDMLEQVLAEEPSGDYYYWSSW